MLTLNPEHLQVPDMAVLHESRKSINHQAETLKLSFLPTLAEKLQHLRATINTADSAFRDQLGNVSVTLAGVDLQRFDEKKTLLEHSNLPAGEKQEALKQLNEQRQRVVAKALETLHKATRSIAQMADDVRQIDLTLKDGSVNQALQDEIVALTAQEEKLTQKTRALAEERKILNDAMDVYEKYSAIEQLKEMLPSAEDLMAVKATTLEIGLVKAALQRLGMYLGKIDEMVKYGDLLEQRDRLRDEYNRSVTESRGVEARLQQLSGQADELFGLTSVEKSRKDWLAEVQKVIEAFRSALAALQSAGAPAPSEHFKGLKSYIDSFFSVTRPI